MTLHTQSWSFERLNARTSSGSHKTWLKFPNKKIAFQRFCITINIWGMKFCLNAVNNRNSGYKQTTADAEYSLFYDHFSHNTQNTTQ